jgi:hypothetical protein
MGLHLPHLKPINSLSLCLVWEKKRGEKKKYRNQCKNSIGVYIESDGVWNMNEWYILLKFCKLIEVNCVLICRWHYCHLEKPSRNWMVKECIMKNIEMHDLVVLSYTIYLGIEIMTQIEWALVHKRKYARDILKRFNMQHCKPVEIGRKCCGKMMGSPLMQHCKSSI